MGLINRYLKAADELAEALEATADVHGTFEATNAMLRVKWDRLHAFGNLLGMSPRIRVGIPTATAILSRQIETRMIGGPKGIIGKTDPSLGFSDTPGIGLAPHTFAQCPKVVTDGVLMPFAEGDVIVPVHMQNTGRRIDRMDQAVKPVFSVDAMHQ